MKLELLLILAVIIFTAGCGDKKNSEKTDEDIFTTDEDSSGDTGNTGDTSDTGNTGNSGDTGDSADSGDTSDTGNTGNTTDTGDTADTGNTGNSGDSGDTGEDSDTAKIDEDTPEADADTETADETADAGSDSETPDTSDIDDTTDDTGTGDDDTVSAPCSASPCSAMENSDGVCTVDGADFICGCKEGYHFSRSLSQCLQTFQISWCNTQYPVDLTGDNAVTKGDKVTFYTQFYISGITQGTIITNAAHTSSPSYPQIIAQFTTGASGTDASSWTEWRGTALPNEDKGNNDEYMLADISMDNDAGDYDFLIRISGDSGNSWTYCNANRLDTLGYNGTDPVNIYSPSKNGHITVSNP